MLAQGIKNKDKFFRDFPDYLIKDKYSASPSFLHFKNVEKRARK